MSTRPADGPGLGVGVTGRDGIYLDDANAVELSGHARVDVEASYAGGGANVA